MAPCANIDLDVTNSGSGLERVPASTMHDRFTVNWMNSLLHTCSSTDLDSLTRLVRQGTSVLVTDTGYEVLTVSAGSPVPPAFAPLGYGGRHANVAAAV